MSSNRPPPASDGAHPLASMVISELMLISKKLNC